MSVRQCQAHFKTFTTNEGCPFFDNSHDLCRAARLPYRPDAREIFFYCSSDDHDGCALYLVQALRSSNPGGLDRDLAAYCGK